MDAPKGRYRVEEKDGRLVVIDTRTGAPASPPPPGVRQRSPGPVAVSPALRDRLGMLLLRLVVSRWDSEGRAIIAWEWEQNGSKRRWDAALDAAQQRRLGRALLGASAFPALILLSIVGSWAIAPLALFAFPAAVWGVWSILRLQRETERSGPD